ncbi:MAG TPA: twin-arginine translocation pathway signal protein [Blastocatellia bacterium]|nr:twin-arginine translocation pathway signal protein [Blastocatellia bacterium]
MTRGPAGTVIADEVKAPSCIVVPESTEGPYFVDEQLNRSDVRAEPSSGSISEGIPFVLTFNVSQIANQKCAPLAGAKVDIWQCDAQGVYSGVSDRTLGIDTVGKKFLRGYQTTDASGVSKFLTIFPGWYRGRTIHIHFKIRAQVSPNQAYEFTSQVYFDDRVSDRIVSQAPYTKGKRDTNNAADRVYKNGGEQTLVALTETDRGYAATFPIGLDLSDAKAGRPDKFSPPPGRPQ